MKTCTQRLVGLFFLCFSTFSVVLAQIPPPEFPLPPDDVRLADPDVAAQQEEALEAAILAAMTNNHTNLAVQLLALALDRTTNTTAIVRLQEKAMQRDAHTGSAVKKKQEMKVTETMVVRGGLSPNDYEPLQQLKSEYQEHLRRAANLHEEITLNIGNSVYPNLVRRYLDRKLLISPARLDRGEGE